MGLGKVLKKINKLADPLGINPTSPGGTRDPIAMLVEKRSDSKMGNMLAAAAAAAAAAAQTPSAPQGTAVEHKTATQAGGLRDITREAVRTEAGGSLDRFYPDYLKKSG